METKQVKKIADVEAKKVVKAHESKMHPGAKKFAKGGVTNESLVKYGRNMARVMNQRGSGRGG
jgi:hypothetical protein